MAGKTTTFANSFLALVFNATTWTSMAQNNASSPYSQIYVSLHSADPTASGNQSSNEIAYTSYARVAVARSSSGWTVSSNSVVPVSAISFPAGTGGSGTAAFFGLGSAASGTGVLFYTGAITPSIVTGNGVTPILTTASTITES